LPRALPTSNESRVHSFGLAAPPPDVGVFAAMRDLLADEMVGVFIMLEAEKETVRGLCGTVAMFAP
jgi:hypothetical protein